MSGKSNNLGFSPDDVGVANGNYFGLPFSVDQSELVLISAPWDVSVSYNEGTADGPKAIMEASLQVELRDSHYQDGWKRGITTAPTDEWIAQSSSELRRIAEVIISSLEDGGAVADKHIADSLAKVNAGSECLNEIIYKQAADLLAQGRIVGLVGGDHSTPLGLMRAVADSVKRENEKFGILHIDAHADLRVAYEGFTYSHASIMYNALESPQVERLVQVGVRDFCEAEAQLVADSGGRIVQFEDHTLAANGFEGVTWAAQCAEIVEQLPRNVYISFDIDGLSPENCSGTGTPVPGGISYREAVYLLVKLVASGRRIVGFDLSEVSLGDDNQEWNANGGARMLYKLCNLTLKSNSYGNNDRT